jgi:hypothetical protein
VYAEVLEKLVSNFQIVQKNVEEFVEARRLAFPRFFFLNDAQFIKFLVSLNSGEQDLSFFVN